VSLAPRLKLDDNGMPTADAVIVIGIRSRRTSGLGQRPRSDARPIPTRLAVVAAADFHPTGESVEVVIEEERDVLADSLAAYRRPCPGGASVGSVRGPGGTLGGVVRWGDGAWCGLLGNNHVLAAMNFGAKGDLICQPAPGDGGTKADVIGHLEAWVPLRFDADNDVDCAVARALDPCDQSVTRHVYGIGIPSEVAVAMPRQIIRKSGKATGVTCGQILSDNATVVVSYGGGLEARFVGQLQYTRMAAGGDSGSLLWDADSLTVVGLHVASGSQCYGNHIDKVLAALGVSLV
jgi:hypothetical protein